MMESTLLGILAYCEDLKTAYIIYILSFIFLFCSKASERDSGRNLLARLRLSISLTLKVVLVWDFGGCFGLFVCLFGWVLLSPCFIYFL